MKFIKRTLAMTLCFVLGMTSMVLANTAPNLNSASSWARDGIEEAYNKGFIPTDVQGNYTDVITRQAFCRMAVKWVEYATGKGIDTILVEQGKSRNSNAFNDTSDPDILAAYALGITSGTGGGQFTPNGQFSREQAATMIMNTCHAIGYDVDNIPASGFADMGSVSSWAVDGINYVRANGIMQGTGNNSFSPKATYTREQSIVTFNNIVLGSTDISSDGYWGDMDDDGIWKHEPSPIDEEWLRGE